MIYNKEEQHFKFYKDKDDLENDEFSFDEDSANDEFSFDEDNAYDEFSFDEDSTNDEFSFDDSIEEGNNDLDTDASNETSDVTQDDNNLAASEEDEEILTGASEEESDEYDEDSYPYEEEEEPKSNSKGLFILLGSLTLIILIGGYVLFTYVFSNNEKESLEQIVEQYEPEPEPEPEPEIEEVEIEPEINEVEIINARTGNAYIIVSSSVDGDLARDFADSLANQGYKCAIISPFNFRNNKLRYRVSIASYPTVSEAATMLNKFRNEIHDKAWVLKY